MNLMTPIGLAAAQATERHHRAVALELRELRAFISVARNGNFGRAARELELSQPTVSHQVQRLEEAVGCLLLLRHGRGATLTPAGARLLDRLDGVAHLLQLPLEQETPDSGRGGALCLGLPPELAPALLPSLVEAVAVELPAVRLEVREASQAVLEEATLNHRVDVAILQDPPNFDSLEAAPAVSEALGLVVGPRCGLARESRPLRLRDLAALPLILADERHWISRRLAGAAFQHGLHLAPRLRIDSLASLKEMLRNGNAGTVLPRVAVQEEIARGALVFRPIEQPSLVCMHAVVTRREAGTAVVALSALTRRVMRRLAHEGAWSGGVAPPDDYSVPETLTCPRHGAAHAAAGAEAVAA